MRFLSWLFVGAGLSLFALSFALHYRIDAPFEVGGPRVASPIERSERIISVKKFGQAQTFRVKKFDNRSEAERMCGKDNVMQWEEITPTHSKDDGYSCRSDLP